MLPLERSNGLPVRRSNAAQVKPRFRNGISSTHGPNRNVRFGMEFDGRIHHLQKELVRRFAEHLGRSLAVR